MGIKTEKEYEVHYYEVNYKLECKISSIINYFCDIGTFQSESLGVGIDYLTERRLAWVFYRYDINIKRYPKFGEKIKVVTKAKSFKKFYEMQNPNELTVFCRRRQQWRCYRR